MSNIVFFNIPAHGHTNPTIEVVRVLVKRGHAVRYYSFDTFREIIEGAGAEFVPCDSYLPAPPKDLDRRVKYDFSSLIDMVVHVTIGMEEKVCGELKDFRPDCIVSDSICIWGKLYAKKLRIPLVCSTTTFAFNQYTAGMMKPGIRELFYSIAGIPKINRDIRVLRQHGYPIAKLTDLIQNDSETDTIVYTSRAFQPKSETFGDKYTFIGPSLPNAPAGRGQMKTARNRPLIYISLGTIIKDTGFFQTCIEALGECPYDMILSVGDEKNAASLKCVPDHVTVKTTVPQLEVLQNADLFITHCGMNSVNESIYFEVPMVMVPQHSEQMAVAKRAQEIGAGIILDNTKTDTIRAAVKQVLGDKGRYQKNIRMIAESFRESGGAEKGADKIERIIGVSVSK